MSGATVTDFWPIGKTKASALRQGRRLRLDGLPVPGRRVLEIGCGVGFRHSPPWGAGAWRSWPSTPCPECSGAAWAVPAGGAGSIEFWWPTLPPLPMMPVPAIEKFAPDTVGLLVDGARRNHCDFTDAGHAVPLTASGPPCRGLNWRLTCQRRRLAF